MDVVTFSENREPGVTFVTAALMAVENVRNRLKMISRRRAVRFNSKVHEYERWKICVYEKA